MEKRRNREKVRAQLEELLQKDKAKTTLNRISDLGLIEMTRKRTRESLGRSARALFLLATARASMQSKETIAYEILREIRRKRPTCRATPSSSTAHPPVADVSAAREGRDRDAENRTCGRFRSSAQRVPLRAVRSAGEVSAMS
jgi:ribonuclease G